MRIAILSDIHGNLPALAYGGLAPATVEQFSHCSTLVFEAVILSGHTHIPRSIRNSKGQLIVNPGSS